MPASAWPVRAPMDAQPDSARAIATKTGQRDVNVLIFVCLTTQAQRRRPRDAWIATATAHRRSLQRMVWQRCHCCFLRPRTSPTIAPVINPTGSSPMMMMPTLPALLSFGERATQTQVNAAVSATAAKAPSSAQIIAEFNCFMCVAA
jgi:hypothetical protein